MKQTTLTILFLISFLSALTIDERDDYSAFSITSQQGINSDSLLSGSGASSETYWIYTTLPSFKIKGKSFYVAVEGEVNHRDIQFNKKNFSKNILHRYGVFGGASLLERGKQKGSLFVGVGVASDFTVLSKSDLYWQLIYDHRVRVSDRLTLGMGILYSYTLGAPKRTSPINLLPTLRWRAHDRIRVSMNWDNLEAKLYLNEKFAFVSEARYDMSWFNLKEYSYQIEEVFAGGGFDIKVATNLFFRGRVYKGLYKREILWDDNSEWIISPEENEGVTVRLLLSFVK